MSYHGGLHTAVCTWLTHTYTEQRGGDLPAAAGVCDARTVNELEN